MSNYLKWKGAMISQDVAHRLVTDTQINEWNNKANASHTHTKSQITDFPASLKNPNSIVIKLNGGSTEGTNLFTYDGSGAKSINITPSAIGAASSSHGHSTIDYLNPEDVTGGTKNDTVAFWAKKGVGLFNFHTTGLIVGQPSQYGNLLNLSRDTEVSQLWFKQSNGDVAHRQGNATGWNANSDNTVSRWVTFLDSNNFTNYAASKSHTHTEIANLDNTYLKLSGGTVTGSILPSGSGIITLGSSDSYWNTLYTSSAYISSIYSAHSLSLSLQDTDITVHKDLNLIGNKLIFGNVNKIYADNNGNLMTELGAAPFIFTQKPITIYKGNTNASSDRILIIDTDDNNIKSDVAIIPSSDGKYSLGNTSYKWGALYTKNANIVISAEDNTDVTFETHKLNSTTDTNSYVGANYTGYIEDSLKAQYNIQYVSNVNGDSYQYDILTASNATLQIGGKIKCNNSWTDNYIDISMNGNVIPVNGAKNLGSSASQWDTVYAKNLTTNAILSFGAQGVTVTATGASNNWYDHASLAVMPDGIINSVPIKSNVVLGADKSLTEELSLINLKNMKASDGHIGLNIKTQKTKTTPAEPSLKFNFVYANGKSGDDAIDVEENILTVTKSAYLNDYEVTLSNINTFTISKVCEITTNISYPFIEPLSSSASFGSTSKYWYNGYFTNLYTSGISAQGSGLNFFKCDTIFFYCSQTTGSSRQWYLSGDSAVTDRIYFKKGSTTYQTEYTYNENGYSIVYGLDIGIKLDVSSKAFSPYKLINAPELSLGQSKSKWTYVYATNGTIQTSNELKKNILGSITEKYENLFMKLEPIMFTWNNETADGNNHDRIHLGLGAQTTKKHMDECNISAEEYALYCEDTVEETDENGNIINTTEYGINYGQLHGLEVHMIQKLKKENDELKDRITKLEELVNSLVK